MHLQGALGLAIPGRAVPPEHAGDPSLPLGQGVGAAGEGPVGGEEWAAAGQGSVVLAGPCLVGVHDGRQVVRHRAAQRVRSGREVAEDRGGHHRLVVVGGDDLIAERPVDRRGGGEQRGDDRAPPAGLHQQQLDEATHQAAPARLGRHLHPGDAGCRQGLAPPPRVVAVAGGGPDHAHPIGRDDRAASLGEGGARLLARVPEGLVGEVGQGLGVVLAGGAHGEGHGRRLGPGLAGGHGFAPGHGPGRPRTTRAVGESGHAPAAAR